MSAVIRIAPSTDARYSSDRYKPDHIRNLNFASSAWWTEDEKRRKGRGKEGTGGGGREVRVTLRMIGMMG